MSLYSSAVVKKRFQFEADGRWLAGWFALTATEVKAVAIVAAIVAVGLAARHHHRVRAQPLPLEPAPGEIR